MRTLSTRSVGWGIAAAALAAAAAGCSSSASSSAGGSQTVQPASGGGTAATTTTQSTSIGTVLADAKGKTIYELVGDPASNAKCDSTCESIWPPVMSGGSVMTLHGHPLFTFSGDSGAAQTHGQGVKDNWGLWLALTPKGTPIAAKAGTPTTPAAPSNPASAPASSGGGGGGGGYGY